MTTGCITWRGVQEVQTFACCICICISDSQKAACYIHIIDIITQPHLSNYNKFITKRSTYYINETVKMNTFTTEFIVKFQIFHFNRKSILYNGLPTCVFIKSYKLSIENSVTYIYQEITNYTHSIPVCSKKTISCVHAVNNSVM
jgi:hypothetical protein